MDKTIKLPEIIPVYPLSNFIFFTKTTVPLNIFEQITGTAWRAAVYSCIPRNQVNVPLTFFASTEVVRPRLRDGILLHGESPIK